MNLNVESLVRSGVVLVIGLPLALGVNSALGTASRLTAIAETSSVPSVTDSVTNDIKGSVTESCVKFLVSKNDSKLEREAKNEIDDTLGGEVNHSAVCKWAL